MAAPAPLSAPAAPKPAQDLQQVLMQVVAEKTGYPTDMLKLDMDLEGDLGIDSIKRVEILAALEDRAEMSARPDRHRLSTMHTLGEILGEFHSLGGNPKPSDVVAAPMPVVAPTTKPAGNTGLSAQTTVLQVVADKTGYPPDMLQPGMDLEGDLGIDSIKRVEILAAIEERAPALAGADRSRLSTMHTLAEIIAYLEELAPPAAVAAATKPAIVAAATQTPSASPAAVLLAVVADKTGYPPDMLNLDMDLEGDLGVDSIKRVEILAAFEAELPALAKADRQQLSSLRTLREIVGALPGAETAPIAAPVRTEIAATPVSIVPIGHAGMPMPNSLGRYALTKVPATATGMAMPGLLGARVQVVGDTPVCAALVTALKLRGIDAEAREPGPDCTALIELGGLQAVDSADQAMAIQARAFARARTIARGVGEAGGLYVTVQDTGGSFGLQPGTAAHPARSWLSGFPALVKTAALEWPKANLRAIDIDGAGRSAEAIAEALANELLAGGGEIEVGLSAKGERCTLQSVLKPVRPSMSVLDTGDVVLVSGGARGVTATCLIEWAKQQKLRFVLLGRTSLQPEPPSCAQAVDEAGVKRVLLGEAMAARESITPSELNARVRQIVASREVRATLAAIAAHGAEAHYLPVDVGNAALLQQALQRVRTTLGPISGLVHAAGVLADKKIADKTDAQFDAVFGTKVLGLDALLRATATDPLKLLAVFSSVSARCGNTGQADYAMANEVIAKVARAEARRRPGLRVKSLGWGPWEGGMVTPHLKARFAELGVPMIPLDIGARMFVDELRDARADDVELVLGGEPRPEALLSDGADSRVQSVEVFVNRDSHAYLGGHAVDGEPVLPAMLAAEWFARASASLRPGMKLKSLHDLRVLKGVRLDRFSNGGQRFRVEARALPGHQGLSWQLQLLDQQGQLRYSARAELGEESARGAKGLPDLQTEAWSGAPLYDQLLFHRGAFELIDTMDGVSDDGALATLRGVDAAGWQTEPWQFDVAALDAGLQMAVLLGQRMLGGPSLPASIGELRRYNDTPSVGPLRAAAFRRKQGSNDVTTDIVLIDGQGRRFAELIGVHNIALPRAQWSAQVA
ncbi:MAG: SDR family oxidoreductase [Ahniella sp.]|nr:SDR family oxidoreductase [Ahniella sp.]